MSEQKSAAEMAAELKSLIDSRVDAIKGMAEDALGKAKNGEDTVRSIKESQDEALTELNAMRVKLGELEQKAAREGSREELQKTFGERFVEDERVKSFLSNEPSSGKVDMRFKATINSATTDTAGAAGAGVQTTRLPGILELPQRRMTIRDLLSQGRMDGSTLEYVRETGFTNNAAPVAELAQKPESDVKFDLVSTSAKVIAHWMKASRQILSDFSQLRSVIDQRLMYGLAYAEENQLLNGDGTGQNLNGIIPQASAFTAPTSITSPTSIDNLRLAMLQAELALFPSTGVVLNPIDWARIELEKDTTGRYIIGNPQGNIAPTIWGRPVVTTQAIAEDKFLTGAFRLGAQVFDRWDARVEVGYVNDDFTKNLVTILAEERLALAVYRPEAFVFGDFGNVA